MFETSDMFETSGMVVRSGMMVVITCCIIVYSKTTKSFIGGRQAGLLGRPGLLRLCNWGLSDRFRSAWFRWGNTFD